MKTIALLLVVGCSDPIQPPHPQPHPAVPSGGIKQPNVDPNGTWIIEIALAADSSCNDPADTWTEQITVVDPITSVAPAPQQVIASEVNCDPYGCELAITPQWWVHGYSSTGHTFTITTVQASTFVLDSGNHVTGSGMQEQTYTTDGSVTADCYRSFVATGAVAR